MTDEEAEDLNGVDAPAFESAVIGAGAPQLSRLTWRIGKKRRIVRREQNWGGQTVAPSAFLAMREKVCFKPGRPGYRICSAMKKDGNPCGMLALKGMKVCAAHGGQLALARQGRLQKSGRAAAAIAAKAERMRSKMPQGRLSDVPSSDLTKLRCYIEASQAQRVRLAMAFQTDNWFGVVMSMKERDDPPDGDRNR